MPETPDPLDEFPRQVARTRGFSLGIPRAFTVSPDGGRVGFLRATAGGDPVSCRWGVGLGVRDGASGVERSVFDPRSTGAEEDEASLTPAERARRERARERSTGVTEYATDRDVRRAGFAMSGRLFLAAI